MPAKLGNIGPGVPLGATLCRGALAGEGKGVFILHNHPGYGRFFKITRKAVPFGKIQQLVDVFSAFGAQGFKQIVFAV